MTDKQHLLHLAAQLGNGDAGHVLGILRDRYSEFFEMCDCAGCKAIEAARRPCERDDERPEDAEPDYGRFFPVNR